MGSGSTCQTLTPVYTVHINETSGHFLYAIIAIKPADEIQPLLSLWFSDLSDMIMHCLFCPSCPLNLACLRHMDDVALFSSYVLSLSFSFFTGQFLLILTVLTHRKSLWYFSTWPLAAAGFLDQAVWHKGKHTQHKYIVRWMRLQYFGSNKTQ